MTLVFPAQGPDQILIPRCHNHITVLLQPRPRLLFSFFFVSANKHFSSNRRRIANRALDSCRLPPQNKKRLKSFRFVGI